MGQSRLPRAEGAPDLVIGPGTEVLAGNGRILTAAGVDCHVHLISRRHAPRRRPHPSRRGPQADGLASDRVPAGDDVVLIRRRPR